MDTGAQVDERKVDAEPCRSPSEELEVSSAPRYDSNCRCRASSQGAIPYGRRHPSCGNASRSIDALQSDRMSSSTSGKARQAYVDEITCQSPQGEASRKLSTARPPQSNGPWRLRSATGVSRIVAPRPSTVERHGLAGSASRKVAVEREGASFSLQAAKPSPPVPSGSSSTAYSGRRRRSSRRRRPRSDRRVAARDHCALDAVTGRMLERVREERAIDDRHVLPCGR
jgi:hypothetical protein